jgi:RNA polymerase sigma factor (sigma-70 family)
MANEREPSRLEAISTRWTLLRAAHDGSSGAAVAARNALVLRYLPAIRRYVGAILRNDHEADDVAQDVLVRLLSGDFAAADPERGRFRDFLKVAIRNMTLNHCNKRKRQRAADYDVVNLPSGDEGDERCWLEQWRDSVLDLVWKALEQQERTQRGNVAYTLLRLRTEFRDDSSEQLASRLSDKLGQPIRADACRQKLRRARLQFADLLIAEVAKGLRDPTAEKIEEELVALQLMDMVRNLLPEDWQTTA